MPVFTVTAASVKKEVPDAKFGPAKVIALTFSDGRQAEWFTKATTAIPAPGSTLEGEVTQTNYGLSFKKASSGGGYGGGGMTPERQRAIQRQHSQDMAVQLMAAFEPVTEGRTAKAYLEVVRELADWFDADVNRVAEVKAPRQEALPPAPANGGQGFSSLSQKDLFTRLLKEAGGSADTTNAIVLYAENALKSGEISQAIDGLKGPNETPRVTAKVLAGDANAWREAQPTDIPADTRDLPVP